MKRSYSYLEFNEDGFIRHTRRWLWFWKHESYEWNSVQSIRAVMWDCFSCNAFGFRLILSNSSSLCITDIDGQWSIFRARLYEVFPDINSHHVNTVEAYFPDEGELVCWESDNPNETH